jgi:hypothetical protein
VVLLLTGHGCAQINCTNLVKFRWEHEGVFHDQDGSLTGSGVPHTMLLPSSPILPTGCTKQSHFSPSGGVPASVCHGVTFR